MSAVDEIHHSYDPISTMDAESGAPASDGDNSDQQDAPHRSQQEPPVESENDPVANSAAASCWEPYTDPQDLYVPLAETWHYHRFVKNRDGETLFSLLKEEQIGRLIPSSTVEPILRMIIGDANGQVAAVIIREVRRGRDGYTIYAPRSAVDTLFETESTSASGSPRVPFLDHFPLTHRSVSRAHSVAEAPYRFQYHPQESRGLGTGRDDVMLELYPVVSVVQGVLGKTYTVQSHDADRTIRWSADNGQFRKTLLFCPWCIAMGLWMWQFEFQDLNVRRREGYGRVPWRRLPQIAPGRQVLNHFVSSSSQRTDGPIVLIRDQEIQTVSIAAGTSPLLALCVTYAMDRLTRPLA
jgi:hypothetical protein